MQSYLPELLRKPSVGVELQGAAGSVAALWVSVSSVLALFWEGNTRRAAAESAEPVWPEPMIEIAARRRRLKGAARRLWSADDGFTLAGPRRS